MTSETLTATAWLGAKLSVIAAALALVLPLLGEVSTWSLVTVVAGAAFTASWVQTGRLERGAAPLLTVGRNARRRAG